MRKILSFIVLLVSIGLVLSACSASTPTPAPTKSTVDIPNVQNGGKTTETVPPAGYPAPAGTPGQSAYPAMAAALKVIKPDGTSVDVDAATLNSLPGSTVTVGTSKYTGIALPDLLAKFGITTYNQITLSNANGSQVLAKDKVTPKVILSTSADGTLQLISPDLPDTNWLKAVNSIKAE